MKNLNFSQFAILAICLVFLGSCSNQLYSYRDKVSVKKESEIVKTHTKAEILESKKAEIRAEKVIVPKLETAIAQENKNPETAKIENLIKGSLPASGSKSSFNSIKNEAKTIKKQFKALHKELKKQDIKEKQALVNNPIKWMVVGLVLIVIGAIIGLLVSAGGFITWIGALIFLIGLLFWLLELI